MIGRNRIEDKTAEGPELALGDPRTRELVEVMLAAGCTDPEIWACLSFQPEMRVN